MHRILGGIIVWCSVLVYATALFAARIYGTPPLLQYWDGSNWNTIDVSGPFYSALDKANIELAKYHDQSQLAKGFANANLYSTNAATQQGYPNYGLFAVTTGIMGGVQLPSFNPDYYDDIDKKIKDKGDIYAGAAASVAMVNVGINASFIIPGLYLNGKFGKFNSQWVYDSDDFDFNTLIIGGGVSYSLIGESGTGLFKWRGVTVGTGLVYQSTNVAYKVKLDKQTENFTDSGISGVIIVDPSFKATLDMYTLSVPFEINTAIQVLWLLNFNLGAGFDICKGNSDLVLKAAATTTVDYLSAGGIFIPKSNYIVVPGTLYIDGSTLGKKPSMVRARIMTGIGLNLGPVKIDVPVIYYLKTGGAVGVTVGFVW